MGLLSAIHYGVHRVWWAGRDWLQPPLQFLSRVGIEPGDTVLDYGCGAGSYALPAAVLSGPGGHVFAADTNPLALRSVREAVKLRGTGNLTVIDTDCRLPLPQQSVDVVLLFDVLQAVADEQSLLAELHRVLKTDGFVSVRSHHLSARRLEALLTKQGLFRLESRGGGLYRYVPQQEASATP